MSVAFQLDLRVFQKVVSVPDLRRSACSVVCCSCTFAPWREKEKKDLKLKAQGRAAEAVDGPRAASERVRLLRQPLWLLDSFSHACRT